MAAQPINPRTNNPFRPYHLPAPTVLPLRHCSHNDDNTPIDEVECLLSLLCPNTETMRNKEHYTLATAEPIALAHDELDSPDAKKRKRAQSAMADRTQKASALRSGARAVPGVPIIYVKRSVMVLEPLSVSSDRVRMGVEKSKFKSGVEAALDIVSGLKRKREDEDEDEDKDGEQQHASKNRGLKKPKAPNPLSMKKPKSRGKQKPEEQGEARKSKPRENEDAGNADTADGDATSTVKQKRKRRHKSAKNGADGAEASIPPGDVDMD
jgi:U3 small nucleolar RNA-associated protein 23